MSRRPQTALLETAGAWEQDACAGAEVREIIGAVDETFLEQMILVLMDLRTGYVLLEDVAENRFRSTTGCTPQSLPWKRWHGTISSPYGMIY